MIIARPKGIESKKSVKPLHQIILDRQIKYNNKRASIHYNKDDGNINNGMIDYKKLQKGIKKLKLNKPKSPNKNKKLIKNRLRGL